MTNASNQWITIISYKCPQCNVVIVGSSVQKYDAAEYSMFIVQCSLFSVQCLLFSVRYSHGNDAINASNDSNDSNNTTIAGHTFCSPTNITAHESKLHYHP